MVYNSQARTFIHEIQKAFRILKLNPCRPEDLRFARTLLSHLAEDLPDFGERLRQMGSSSLRHDTRFCDTFFHVHETRLSLGQWLQSFKAAGLEPIGLLDRYGELDHLPNPLWHFPSEAQLGQSITYGLFANNFEIHLLRPGAGSGYGKNNQTPPHFLRHATTLWHRLHLNRRAAPTLWRGFPETAKLSAYRLWRIWCAHNNHVYGGGRQENQASAPLKIPLEAAQRLARLGAILPSQVANEQLRASLGAPLAAAEPQTPVQLGFLSPATRRLIADFCDQIPGNRNATRCQLAESHFSRAGNRKKDLNSIKPRE